MPYISEDRRDVLEPAVSKIVTAFHELNQLDNKLCAGDLNYLITVVCHEYIRANDMCYQTFNDIMGALSGVDKELYRVMTGPYEEVKRIKNGRVSDIEG